MFNIRLSVRGLAVWGFASAAVASAAAQSGTPHEGVPKAEVAVGYSYLRANATPGQCGCFNLNGGSAEAAVHVYRTFSVVADVTGYHAGKTSVSVALAALLYRRPALQLSAAPRAARNHITPFVQGLVGAVHGFDAPFPNGSATLASSANALAVLLGGGVDIAVGHRFAIRAVQVDCGLNHLPNNVNNSENLFRVATGVVFHIR